MHKQSTILLCAFFLPTIAVAQADQAPATDTSPSVSLRLGEPQAASEVPQTAVAPPADSFSVLDQPHDYLAKKFVGMVSDIDRFFGDNLNFQEGNQSVLQIDLARAIGYGSDQRFVLAGRTKVQLPNTEKRLHLLLESDPDKNPSGDPPPVITTPFSDVAAPGSYAAGLRYEQTQHEKWFFSTDGGLKFQGLSSTPFARARASYSPSFETWRIKFAESPFWFNTLGVGASSQLYVEHALSEPVVFRATSNATWLHDKQNFDLSQDISVYHTLDERRALLYQASAIGASQPQFHATDYVLLVLYRQRLHQKWMFLEISPQMHYPQARSYQPSPALTFRLEMLFDTSAQH